LPLWTRKWPFFGYSIESAPLDPGVYGLWKDGELIFIGSSDSDGSSIRSRLVKHFLEADQAGAVVPDHYSWEVADDVHQRKAEVLAQFQGIYGRLPRWNTPPAGVKEPGPSNGHHR
jgi:hypothetical protein